MDLYENIYKSERLTFKQKMAKDCLWGKRSIQKIDYFWGDENCDSRNKRFRLNERLAEGHLSPPDLHLFIESQTHNYPQFSLGKRNLQHKDIITQPIRYKVGENLKRPFDPRALDTSENAFKIREEKTKEKYTQLIQQNTLEPLFKIVQQDFQAQNPDVPQEPEALQDYQNKFKQQIQERTPKEIKAYMNRDFRVPSEKQAQVLLNYSIREQDMKHKFSRAYKWACVTSMEVVFIESSKVGLPYLEVICPADFYVHLPKHKFWIEEGTFCKYERQMTIYEIQERYDLTLPQIKKLEGYHTSDTAEDYASRRLVGTYSVDELNQMNLNTNTKEGNHNMIMLRGSHINVPEIRVVHCQWRALSKKLKITRLTDSGVKETYEDEDYVFNPAFGDVEEEVIWTPQVWEGYKAGEDIFFGIRPIPNQYSSLEDPFHVELSYKGLIHNRIGDEPQGVSDVDLMAPWQFWYDLVSTRIDSIQETNIGKVMTMFTAAKPEDWTWEKWMTVLKEGKIAVLQTHLEGVSQVDLDALKGIDLSNNQDLAKAIELLRYIEDRGFKAIGYNQSTMGQASPYKTATANQQDIVQSLSTTEVFNHNHNLFIERVLQSYLDVCRHTLKGTKLLTYLLGDMSLAEIEIDWEILDRAKLGIFISNQADDAAMTTQSKQMMLPLIQNQLIQSPLDLHKFIRSKTNAELDEVLRGIEEKLKGQAQQQQQQAQGEQQLQQQLMEWEKQKFMISEQNAIIKEEIDADERRKAHDVNQNNVDDDKELEVIKLTNSLLELREKYRQEDKLKDKELKSKEKLDMAKIKSQEKIAKMNKNKS